MNSLLQQIENDLCTLDSIAKPVLNLSVQVARRKAALGALPVPAFRLGASRRGPLYVKREDLDELLQKRYKSASDLRNKMRHLPGT